MTIGIKTDQPYATISFGDQTHTWEAGRKLSQELLPELEKLVGDWKRVSGIVVFKGPGSFTGLRIGITVANTLAYGLDIPIVGAQGEEWLAEGNKRLEAGENEKIVQPHYGAEPNISKPKK